MKLKIGNFTHVGANIAAIAPGTHIAYKKLSIVLFGLHKQENNGFGSHG